jgi:hypothetical protein
VTSISAQVPDPLIHHIQKEFERPIEFAHIGVKEQGNGARGAKIPSLIEIKVIVIHKAVVQRIGINHESDEYKEKNEYVIR